MTITERPAGAARILHTSDWHLGVSLRNRSRAADHDAAIAEIIEIATNAAPDLIVHTGDLFDGHRPPMGDFGRAIVALRNLAEIAPVVVLAGNHDSAAALDVLATALDDDAPEVIAAGTYDPFAPCQQRIRVLARPATALGGAVTTYPSAAGVPIRFVGLPFVHANRVLKEFGQLAASNTAYVDNIRKIIDLLSDSAFERFDPGHEVAVFASHVHVGGAALSSERTVHVAAEYATDPGHLPAGYGYLAFGHIHVPQPVAGGRGRYAGSIIEVDFGEEGETKEVVLVDLEPGRPARIQTVSLTRARRLRRVRTTLGALADEAGRIGTDLVEVAIVQAADDPTAPDGPIVIAGIGPDGGEQRFDTLSAAVAAVLPDAEVISVIDARRRATVTADELPAASEVTVADAYRRWLEADGRPLIDKHPAADIARLAPLLDLFLAGVQDESELDIPEESELRQRLLEGS